MEETLVVYQPWSVSGELVQEAPGHEDESNWAVVIVHADTDTVELVEDGLTYEEARDRS